MELNDWDEYGYEPPHWIEVDEREFYPCCTHTRTAEAALNALSAKALA